MLEDETDTESKEHIITILASLRSCPLFPIRMSTLCVNLTIINTLPLHLCSTWQLWEGGWGRLPSLKMQCCLCTLTLLLQSHSLLLCCCVSDALLLHLHWAPTHFWTFWHMSVPLLGPRGERREFAKQRRAHKKETVHWTDSAPNLCTWLSHFSAVQQMTMYSISFNLEWVPLCKIGWKQSHVNILTDDWCN